MDRKNPAQRRYLWRFAPTMTGYVVLLLLANHLLKGQPTGAALVAVSLLPALPIVGVIVVMGLYLLEERDEFLRNRLATAMLWGTGILLSTATVWGFMAEAGAVAPPPVYLAFPLWCAAIGIVQGAMALRDRIGVAP